MKKSAALIKLYDDANNGDPLAQVMLGKMQEYGIYLSIDKDSALHWYQSAADSNFSPGQYCLAMLLNETDVNLARYWLEKAVVQEYSPAQYALACVYWIDVSDKKNPELAIKLLENASHQNYVPALIHLSGIYNADTVYGSEEKGIKKNLELARAYALQAAKIGSVEGEILYGMITLRHGSNREKEDGLQFLQKAAGAGNVAACGFLADLYASGLYGVDRNQKLANHYGKLTKRVKK